MQNRWVITYGANLILACTKSWHRISGKNSEWVSGSVGRNIAGNMSEIWDEYGNAGEVNFGYQGNTKWLNLNDIHVIVEWIKTEH